MVHPRPPHPANVPGDFYVEDSCCTMCEVPFTEAPDLFGTIEDPEGYQHCYVKRQPATPAELDDMVSAIRCAELQCIHYRGSDLAFQTRLFELGEGMVCDNLPPDLRTQAEKMDAEKWRQFYARQKKERSWLYRVRAWWRGRA